MRKSTYSYMLENKLSYSGHQVLTPVSSFWGGGFFPELMSIVTPTAKT